MIPVYVPLADLLATMAREGLVPLDEESIRAQMEELPAAILTRKHVCGIRMSWHDRKYGIAVVWITNGCPDDHGLHLMQVQM